MRSLPRRPHDRQAILGLVALSALLFLSCATKRGNDSPPRPSGPELELTTSVSKITPPATVLLTARLYGVQPDDPTFFDPQETWIKKTRDVTSRSPRTSTSPADTEAEPRSVKLEYSRAVHLSEPGRYKFRLLLRATDGTEITSNWVKVKVRHTKRRKPVLGWMGVPLWPPEDPPEPEEEEDEEDES